MEDAPLSEELEPSPPTTASILVVDDDPSLREIVCTLLSIMGLDSQEAPNGAVAVDMYRAQSKAFDLVIMDIVMPQMDGIEATLKIREIDPLAKVILLSGYTEHDVWSACPDAFLLKPYMLPELRAVIQKLLG
jgi:CheY-like chemotaxis protein